MRAYGVDLYLDKLAVDTTTPSGPALLQMAGVFAEFEREMIRERPLAGQVAFHWPKDSLSPQGAGKWTSLWVKPEKC
jgi:Resolvase, N terminal domain